MRYFLTFSLSQLGITIPFFPLDKAPTGQSQFQLNRQQKPFPQFRVSAGHGFVLESTWGWGTDYSWSCIKIPEANILSWHLFEKSFDWKLSSTGLAVYIPFSWGILDLFFSMCHRSNGSHGNTLLVALSKWAGVAAGYWWDVMQKAFTCWDLAISNGVCRQLLEKLLFPSIFLFILEFWCVFFPKHSKLSRKQIKWQWVAWL